MTLEQNLKKELKCSKTGGNHLLFSIMVNNHGLEEALNLYTEQLFWNIEQRALVNGQEEVKKEK